MFDYDCAHHLTLPLNYDTYQHILRQAQFKRYELIKLNLNKAPNASKEYYHQKAHKGEINVNDLILLVNNKKGNKIQPDFIGPFIITNIANLDNDTITTRLPNRPCHPQHVAISHLKPFIPRPAKDTFITEAGGPQSLQIDADPLHYPKQI
uniref:Uncharacterized protein n=1 Tax=Romanomermis culicivorax TaxID=13658 RepID=A0A915KDX0_ROMCU